MKLGAGLGFGPRPSASWASGLCYRWGLTAGWTGLAGLAQRPSRPASPRRRCTALGCPACGHYGHTQHGGVDAGGPLDIKVGRGVQGRTGGVRPTCWQGGLWRDSPRRQGTGEGREEGGMAACDKCGGTLASLWLRRSLQHPRMEGRVRHSSIGT
jgi:hypothetical protein